MFLLISAIPQTDYTDLHGEVVLLKMLSITTIHSYNLNPLCKKAGIQYSFSPGI